MQRMCWYAVTVAGCAAVALLLACDDDRPLRFDDSAPTSPSPAVARAGAAFDPAQCGRVCGVVRWDGPVPNVPTIDHPETSPANGIVWTKFVNPHAPRVDAHSRGVGNAVVWLRGVSTETARGWDHPLVRVEARDRLLYIHQGQRIGNVGVVRVGDHIELVSRSELYHAVAGRGAAFFAATLPIPERPVTRQLTTPGVVELTSAAGHYWARAWLFVCEHPYWTLTEADGSFSLEQVPAGQYELVVWHPNPQICTRQRDPESTMLTRLNFALPLEWVMPLTVTAQMESRARVTLNQSHFPSVCP